MSWNDSTRSLLALAVDLRDAAVLLVSDGPRETEPLLLALTEAGLKVLCADNGPVAKQRLLREPVDLVIVNLKRADMDSFELLRQIKIPPQTRFLPVLFFFTASNVDAKVRAFRAGASDFVEDALDFSELLVRIEHHIRVGRKLREQDREKNDLKKELRELRQEAKKHTQPAPTFVNLAELPAGFVLDGKYRIDSLIGTGGFGVVYKALHVPLGRLVAVKVFRSLSNVSAEDSLRRIVQEGASASRLQHPNAVTTLDMGVAPGGIAYMAMELLVGRTLAEELKEKSALSLARTTQIALSVCDVLVEAHAARLIHRDIKPENVFLHKTHSGEIVKLLDFGIAKMLGESGDADRKLMTAGGGIIGTPFYMAPERLRQGTYDGRSDVYSVGVMMYQMLTGKLPFSSDKESYVEIVLGHLNQSVPPLIGLHEEIPDKMAWLVMRTLEKDPILRPTARELHVSLLNVLREPTDSLAVRTAESARTSPGRGRASSVNTGYMGYMDDVGAEKTGEVPAVSAASLSPSAQTLSSALSHHRTIEEEPVSQIQQERTQEMVRPSKNLP